MSWPEAFLAAVGIVSFCGFAAYVMHLILKDE